MDNTTIESFSQEYNSKEKDELIWIIVNREINSFISNYSDYKKDEEDIHWHWKRVPYIGWFWRSTDFYNKRISIWDCWDFIWIMENNKWDYSERNLSEEEADKVIKIVLEAKELSEKWWCLSDILKNTHNKLDELWDLFQTFTI